MDRLRSGHILINNLNFDHGFQVQILDGHNSARCTGVSGTDKALIMTRKG